MANEYYEQEIIWGNGIHTYQEQVLKTILQVIPSDVETILDIGCGDGYITNVLNEKYKVTGMDISAEALKYIEGDTAMGNITDIPFPNNKFDLVMVNDVLEHIPEEEYPKALRELCRVTRKYVLVTVPHEEDVEDKSVICTHCGEEYHVNLHQRSYDKNKMLRLLTAENVHAEILIYTGDVGTVPYNPIIDCKKQLGINYSWQGAVCPKCGYKDEELIEKEAAETINRETAETEITDRETAEAASIEREKELIEEERLKEVQKEAILDRRERENIYYVLRQASWKKNTDLVRNNRSEIMCLYAKGKVPKLNAEKHRLYPKSVLDVNFSNCLQETQEICEGQEWTRWQKISGLDYDGKAVRRMEEAEFGYGCLYYPYAAPKDGLLIKGKGLLDEEGEEKVAFYVIDAITEKSLKLERKRTEEGELIYQLPRNWYAVRFGYKLDFYLYGDAEISDILYVSEVKREAGFWKVGKGFNLIELGTEREVYRRYLFSKYQNEIQVLETVQAEQEGEIPVIVPIHAEEKADPLSLCETLVDILASLKRA